MAGAEEMDEEIDALTTLARTHVNQFTTTYNSSSRRPSRVTELLYIPVHTHVLTHTHTQIYTCTLKHTQRITLSHALNTHSHMLTYRLIHTNTHS